MPVRVRRRHSSLAGHYLTYTHLIINLLPEIATYLTFYIKISTLIQKTVDGQKEKQSNSARLQGKPNKTVGNDFKQV